MRVAHQADFGSIDRVERIACSEGADGQKKRQPKKENGVELPRSERSGATAAGAVPCKSGKLPNTYLYTWPTLCSFELEEQRCGSWAPVEIGYVQEQQDSGLEAGPGLRTEMRSSVGINLWITRREKVGMQLIGMILFLVCVIWLAKQTLG
jgi:hypothetical protein